MVMFQGRLTITLGMKSLYIDNPTFGAGATDYISLLSWALVLTWQAAPPLTDGDSGRVLEKLDRSNR